MKRLKLFEGPLEMPLQIPSKRLVSISKILKPKTAFPFNLNSQIPKPKNSEANGKKLLISDRSSRVFWSDFSISVQKLGFFLLKIRNGSTSRNRRLHKRNNQWILRPTSLCSHFPIKASRLWGCLFPSPWPTPSPPWQISQKDILIDRAKAEVNIMQWG